MIFKKRFWVVTDRPVWQKSSVQCGTAERHGGEEMRGSLVEVRSKRGGEPPLLSPLPPPRILSIPLPLAPPPPEHLLPHPPVCLCPTNI